jgi:hypothetical protein
MKFKPGIDEPFENRQIAMSQFSLPRELPVHASGKLPSPDFFRCRAVNGQNSADNSAFSGNVGALCSVANSNSSGISRMAIGIRRSSGRGYSARRLRVSAADVTRLRSMFHRVPTRQQTPHSRIRLARVAQAGNPANDLELLHAVLFAVILPFGDGQLTNLLCGAVHAVTAVALLESNIDDGDETPQLLMIATALRLPWFSELVADAVDGSVAELQKHSTDVARLLATVTQQALEPFKRIIPCT